MPSPMAAVLSPWNTSQALLLFRQSAEKVVREYLKAQNKKLRKGRRREHMIRNEDAYRDGIEGIILDLLWPISGPSIRCVPSSD
jgi:hypothetical protein